MRGATRTRIVSSDHSTLFQSTHPLRGATGQLAPAGAGDEISIHAPLAGCDHPTVAGWAWSRAISIHAPLAGCDFTSCACRSGFSDFNPRTPCGVRPCWLSREYSQKNFNPRTPCGVRRKTRRRLGRSSIFQSTHPLRGATTDMRLPQQHLLDFNPRTPCGVRLCQWCKNSDADKFQSTHPLRGATIALAQRKQAEAISIHAPLAGCDLRKPQPRKPQPNFNPRTPCGVRPRDLLQSPRQRWNFNPRTPCGVRRSSRFISARSPNFNPRTPCGVRPGRQQEQPTCSEFQSTHPLRGATREREQEAAVGGISIHAPLAGCDEEAS